MIRGVMIGLGNVALNGHGPAWKKNPEVQIVAGVDADPERRALFQKEFPGAPVFSSLQDCAGLAFDFVDISTPPHTHFTLAKQALDQGLHVLCEKPLVLSESDFQALRDSATRADRLLMTVHNWKFSPICARITDILRRNVLGEIKHCAWYVLRNGPSITTDPNNWRLDPKKSGGGILIDHGWHAFYLLLHWLERRPKSVHATLENRQYEALPVEDTAKVVVEFEREGGALTAEVFLTWASRVRRNWGIIEGANGTLHIDDNALKVVRHLRGAVEEKEVYSFEQGLSQGSHHPEWFEQVIHEFLGEINDRALRGRNLQIAQSCLELIERSKESSGARAQVVLR